APQPPGQNAGYSCRQRRRRGKDQVILLSHRNFHTAKGEAEECLDPLGKAIAVGILQIQFQYIDSIYQAPTLAIDELTREPSGAALGATTNHGNAMTT